MLLLSDLANKFSLSLSLSLTLRPQVPLQSNYVMPLNFHTNTYDFSIVLYRKAKQGGFPSITASGVEFDILLLKVVIVADNIKCDCAPIAFKQSPQCK